MTGLRRVVEEPEMSFGNGNLTCQAESEYQWWYSRGAMLANTVIRARAYKST